MTPVSGSVGYFMIRWMLIETLTTRRPLRAAAAPTTPMKKLLYSPAR
jgi:hypothetical protein